MQAGNKFIQIMTVLSLCIKQSTAGVPPRMKSTMLESLILSLLCVERKMQELNKYVIWKYLMIK